MKIKMKHGITAACVSLCLCLGGCSLNEAQEFVNAGLGISEVFKIKGQACTLPEAKVVLTNYQNMYATMYGIDLWSHSFGGDDLETYIKGLTISRLAQIMAMDFLAEEKGISLTDEENRKVKAAAEEYYRSLNEAEKEYMGVKEGDIEILYQRYGLANKLYTNLTEEVDGEVSDDEARIMEAQQIVVSEEEKAEEVELSLEEGTDFLSVASAYNESSETEVTFGRADVPPEVEEEAFSMENDEISGRIETEKGYYFIKCINHFNQEKTDINKSVILEKRRKEAFDDVYQNYLDTLPSEFYENVWEEVKIEVRPDVATDSFFDVYEKYCSW